MFIVKNFIANAFRYRPQGYTSTLAIAFERPRGIDATKLAAASSVGIVRIECSITPQLDDELVAQLGRRSVSRIGRLPRRGLHLVGVVTRQLGGTFEAFQDRGNGKSNPRGDRTRIMLRIPMANDEGLGDD